MAALGPRARTPKTFFFDGSTTNKRSFSFTNINLGANAVAAGGYHSIVLTQEGHVFVAGWNKYGQLVDWSTFDSKTFIREIGMRARLYHEVRCAFAGGVPPDLSNPVI